MAQLLVAQAREYRLHRLEILDHGRDGFSVAVHPPPGRGEVQQFGSGQGSATLADAITRARAAVDAVMGPKRPPPTRPAGRGWR